ncbi:MAG: YfhO family protein [Nitrospirae bacterium]|nr:YfhO family protein [Nitrospirota bacterium]
MKALEKLKASFFSHLPYAALMAVVHAVVYRDYWTGHKIIGSRDFLFLEVPTANFNADCLASGSYPLWNPFINFGFPWVEHYLNTSFSLTHLFAAFISGSNLEIVQRELFFWIFLGGAGIYLCLHELGKSKVSAMIAGICFMFSGQIFMLPSENYMIYNACAFPFIIYGYLRARNSGGALSLVSIFFMTQFLLAGYIATAVLGCYLLIFYVLFDSLLEKKIISGLKFLALTFIISLLLSAPKLLPLYMGMKATARLSGDYGSVADPFNLLSLYDLQSLLIPVKYFFSVYAGIPCVAGLAYCIVKKRLRPDPLLILAVLSGWLLITDEFGNLSWLRQVSYNLPFARLVRVEWLHWYYPTIFAILYCCQFLDDIFSEADIKVRIAAALGSVVVVSGFFLWQYDTNLHLIAYLTSVSMLVLWFVLPHFLKFERHPAVFALAAALLLSIEFGAFIERVDINEPPRRDERYIEIRTTDQWGASHSFRDDNRVSKMKYIVYLRDGTRPSIDESRKWPYLISAQESQWQENLLVDLVNQKRFAGWWNNAMVSFEFGRMYGAELDALDRSPLYALIDRAAASPNKTVSLDNVSCSGFTFSTESDADGALLLNQMWDRRWRAYIDGAETPVERANTHFMGVDVPGGRHTVRFAFRDNIFYLSLCISFLTLAALVLLMLLRKRSFYFTRGPVV